MVSEREIACSSPGGCVVSRCLVFPHGGCFVYFPVHMPHLGVKVEMEGVVVPL